MQKLNTIKNISSFHYVIVCVSSAAIRRIKIVFCKWQVNFYPEQKSLCLQAGRSSKGIDRDVFVFAHKNITVNPRLLF
ncbi:MAG: hypothetical protein C4589_07135 [Peptococcaceae bacterium]|nr:MAG: hypothetical protein C4589_07135 [Peptococcaceae bacterium]